MATVYSRAEQFSDAAVHIAGVLFALIAVPVLVTLAAVRLGDVPTVLAALVYGVCLIAMVSASAIYHMTPTSSWKGLLRRLDHTAIYLKIAGTYTPFAVLSGAHVGVLLAGLWGAAIAGASLHMVNPQRFRWVCFGLYLGMGWAGALIGGPMIEALTPAGFALVLIGGALYTLGVVFFLWEKLPFHNTIWHAFVLAASSVFYAAVVVEISVRATVTSSF